MTQARISTYNDLTDLGGGMHSLDFRRGKDNGSVQINNSDLARKWFCSYEFKISSNWSWGSTGYDDDPNDRFLANIKMVRFWNPGSTPENVLITMEGWHPDGGSCLFNIENISVNDKDQKRYFFGNYKNRITRDVWHKLEFEFEENTSPGLADGSCRIWFNGNRILNEVGLITRKNESGYKRPRILGWDSVWGPSGDDKAPNDFMIRNIYAGMNEARADQGTPPIDPNIIPPNIVPPILTPFTYPRTLEKINDGIGRLKVPGGWVMMDRKGHPDSMIFVNDPNHDTWVLE